MKNWILGVVLAVVAATVGFYIGSNPNTDQSDSVSEVYTATICQDNFLRIYIPTAF